MSVSHIGEQSPEVSHAPKPSAIPGLKTKIMAALAAIGLTASVETSEGAITITGTTSSTVTEPTNRNVTGVGATDFYTGVSERSSLYSNKGTNGQLVTSTSTFAVINVTSADAGLYGGTLTISGWQIMGLGGSFGTSTGYNNTTFSFLHQLRGIPNSGPTATIGSWGGILGNGSGLNDDGASSVSLAEAAEAGLPQNNQFSFNINVPVGGLSNYQLQNYIEALNTEAHGRFTGASLDNNSTMSFSFTPNQIPEPNTTALLGGALASLLLRRRREKNQD